MTRVEWPNEVRNLEPADDAAARTSGFSIVFGARGGEDELTVLQTLRAMEVSGVFEFWDHPDEDVYSEDDGDEV